MNFFSIHNKELKVQLKWLFFALLVSFVLVAFLDSAVLFRSRSLREAKNTFLGLNFFLEILIFFAFSTFVVFGIKGFFETFTQKTANIIILISGMSLLFVILILLGQIILHH